MAVSWDDVLNRVNTVDVWSLEETPEHARTISSTPSTSPESSASKDTSTSPAAPTSAETAKPEASLAEAAQPAGKTEQPQASPAEAAQPAGKTEQPQQESLAEVAQPGGETEQPKQKRKETAAYKEYHRVWMRYYRSIRSVGLNNFFNLFASFDVQVCILQVPICS